MKLAEMNLELAQDLMSLWIDHDDARTDEMKDPDLLYNLLFYDKNVPKAQFYHIPGLVIIATEIKPGKGAVIFEIGLLADGYDVKEAKKMLIEIVREYNLKRLTFACPSPVTAFSPRLKAIGLKYEGRMRHGCTYNGKLADVDLFGFYSVKPSNRRRRGRRGKKDSGQTGIATSAEQSA